MNRSTPRAFGFDTRVGPRRTAARPVHRRARRADLPDHQLRLRRHRIGRGLLQPAGVRQHLLAHHEPDGGHVRGAGRQPGGRRRRRRLRQRSGRAGGGAVHHAPAGRPHRRLRRAVRRHGHPAQAPVAQVRPRADVRRSGRHRRLEASAARRDQAAVRRDDRQSRAATCSTFGRSPTSRTTSARR